MSLSLDQSRESNTDKQARIDKANMIISQYKNRSIRVFNIKKIELIHSYAILNQPYRVMNILENTRGNTLGHECQRLLLLNQFEAIVKYITSDQILSIVMLRIKSISLYYYLGYNSYTDQYFSQSQDRQIAYLHYLQQIQDQQVPLSDLSIIFSDQILHIEAKFRKADQNNYKIQYIERFRLQAYHHQYLKSKYYLNQFLITMNLNQMQRILKLPTDYFDQYYQWFMYTVMKLLRSDISVLNIVIEIIDKALESIEIPSHIITRYLNENTLFLSYVQNGVIKGIVNKKIKLRNKLDYFNTTNSEQITGFLDGLLIVRRLIKCHESDPIDDIIYDTLIYKLE